MRIGDLNVEGELTGFAPVLSLTVDTLLTRDQVKGHRILVTGVVAITLPPVEVGAKVTIYSMTSDEVIVRPNDNDSIILNGVAGTAGCGVVGSVAGDLVTLLGDSSGWIVTGRYGTWASESILKFQVVYVSTGTFTLPIFGGGAGYAHNFSVSWGDGTNNRITSFDDADRIHTYAGAGTYTVTMSGTCEWFNFNNSGDKEKIRWILAFSGDMGFKVLSFYGCTSLSTIISLGTKASLITASDMFRGCTGITSIPSSLFDGCPLVTSFANAFNSCTGINTGLPANIFLYNLVAENFESTFSGCLNMTGLGQPIIDNTALSGHSVPTATANCFTGCNGLTDWSSLPLAWGGGGVANFKFQVVHSSSGTFTLPITGGGAGYAHNFTVNWGDGSPISTVTSYNDPDRIHTYTSAGTYDITMTGTCEWFNFQVDWQFAGRIRKLLLFSGDMGFRVLNFAGCNNLNTIVPLGTKASLTSALQMFQSVSITSIPSGMFAGCPVITRFDNTFYGCTGLTSLPADLFRYNTTADRINLTFYGCTGLASLPADLFRYNINVTRFDSTFNNCTALASIPADLFKYNINVTRFDFTFYNCRKLRLNETIFWGTGERDTRFHDKSINFSRCFERSSFTGTQGIAPDLWNCDFGTGTPTKTSCFAGSGNSLASLSNYASIPSAWK